ncbi:MAG: tRNA (adenosine(37)-N6)-threonylcarbamoyltransferase complex ATPase subunit type 1 TsaE [Oscillospiraceae bacterium]|nr:tRNA (adenosine(37)-N6)-threonylcarbamoyltransferase complex ATPase subunit type 1 TsaE [Candidatus Equicaccousia limihippi]
MQKGGGLTEFISHSREDTVKFAENLVKRQSTPVFFALFGSMGMGKTAFAQGVAQGCGYGDYVSSPTFNIINIYEGEKTVYHFDMYRVNSEDDLLSTGYFDYIEDEGGVTVCEWSENIAEYLPQNALKITIERLSENERKITVEENL